jgi:small basic protein
VDFYHLLGYFSGLLFIKPDIEAVSLYRTIALVHCLDAILCSVIAAHSGRRTVAWSIGGLVFGIWALGMLFLLPGKKPADG